MRDGRNLQTWPDFERAHGISPDKLIGKTVRTGAGGWHLFKVVRLHRDSVYHVRAVRVRAALEEQHGQVWSTGELREGFTVQAFMAPLVVVTRKEDGVEGTLFFQHNPRFYFGWQSGEEE